MKFFGKEHKKDNEINEFHQEYMKLLEETVMLRSVIDTGRMAIRFVDKDFRIKLVNCAMEDISGIKREKAMGMKCYNHMKMANCQTEQCPLVRILDGESEIDMEYIKQTEDGNVRYYKLIVFPAKNERGEVTGIIENYVDITELRNAEADMENISMELSMAISEYFEVLKKLGDGDTSVRASSDSNVEIVASLGKVINKTAESIERFVADFHDLAIGISEQFSVLQQLERGDLTVNASESFDNELLVSMGKLLNSMISGIRNMVTDVNVQTALVTDSSGNLAQIAEQSSETVGQLSSMMQQIADSAAQVASSSQSASTSSAKADQASRSGRETMEQLLEKMKLIQESINAAMDSMRELEKRSEQINKIVAVITKIADQTNLLSLNAAIEAARAGEAGRGFAVVADEVRKLAELSTTQAHEISSIIRQVIDNTQTAVKTVNTGLKEVIEGRMLVDKSHQMFLRVAESIKEVATEVEGIAGAAEETAASAQEGTAGAQEQTASMEEISASSTELHAAAKKVREAVSKFKVK
ncbi:MAG: methyl-accepting chemotaxis protein [Elusimicrobiota bacterium]